MYEGNHQLIVAGIGEILWDCLPNGKVLGGAPANFAYHASRFGLEGYAVSAIGKDPLGREILDVLEDKRLHHLVEPVDYPTGMVQVTLDEKGVPEYEICEGVAWDHIPFTTQTEELARHCRAVCFGSLAQRGEVSKETILQFISLVPAECLKIFDINLRQHFYSEDIIRHSLAACDILKINDEETLAVAKLFGWNDSSEEEISHRLLKEYKLKAVVETKGVVGSYVFTAEEISYLDTPKVAVVDTVGAGDAFTGALVAGLLQGNTIHEAHRLAVDVSAYVCTRTGAMPE